MKHSWIVGPCMIFQHSQRVVNYIKKNLLLLLKIKNHPEFFYDILVFGFSVPVSYVLRSGISYLENHIIFIFQLSLLYGLCASVFMIVMKMPQKFWRYTSVQDIFSLVSTISLSILFWFFLITLTSTKEGVPKSLPVILFMVSVLLTCGARIIVKFLSEGKVASKNSFSDRVPVYLIGNIEASDKTIVALKNPVYSHYLPIGIIGTHCSSVGKNIRGVPVIGTIDNLEKILTLKNTQKPKIAIFVNSFIETQYDSDIFRKFTAAGIITIFLPSLTKSFSANKNTNEKLDYDLLLRRSRFDISTENIESLINGKKILITGAGGSIGSEIVRKVCSYNPKSIVMLDNSEYLLYLIELEISALYPDIDKSAILADVRNALNIQHIMRTHKPDIVFHAAAIKHVPLSESNPGYAFDVNVMGTRNVFDAANQSNVQLTIMISTDKAVNPTSIMGATKQIAEMICLAMSENAVTQHKFLTIRFGNVIGSNGSVIPLFEKQIDAGGPVTVTHKDVTRFFMTIDEAVNLVLQAASLRYHNRINTNSGICVLNMGKSVQIKDLAEQMIVLKGKKPYEDIDIIYTGLRPGEKLYEELFSTTEQMIPTLHDWLSIASSDKKRTFYELYNGIKEIELSIKNNEVSLTKTLIKNLSINFQEENDFKELQLPQAS